jgi:hypothetical protein
MREQRNKTVLLSIKNYFLHAMLYVLMSYSTVASRTFITCSRQYIIIFLTF